MPPQAFARTGIHTERGKITLETQVRLHVDHLAHHMEFVRKKRQKLNKPLKD